MKKRLIIQVELDVDAYCQEQAELLGISKSGFINVVISQYRQQNDIMGQLPMMLKAMQETGFMGQIKGGKK